MKHGDDGLDSQHWDVTTSTVCVNEPGNGENTNANALAVFGITNWTGIAASVPRDPQLVHLR
jgi:hypothetical protein